VEWGEFGLKLKLKGKRQGAKYLFYPNQLLLRMNAIKQKEPRTMRIKNEYNKA